MSDQSSTQHQHYDDRKLDVDYAPDLDNLLSLARRNLANWLDYVAQDPSLAELKVKSAEIMDAIQTASAFAGLEDMVARLAVAVDSKFERLGLWQAWYP